MRKFFRHSSGFTARALHKGTWANIEVLDITPTGAKIQGISLKTGEEVEIESDIISGVVDSDAIIIGKAVWVEGSTAGVEFTKKSAEGNPTEKRYIDNCQYYDPQTMSTTTTSTPICLVNEPQIPQILQTLLSSKTHAVLQTADRNYEYFLNLACQFEADPNQIFQSQLSDHELLFDYEFNRFSQREELHIALQNLAKEKIFLKRYIPNLTSIVEELFLNAILAYHPPTEVEEWKNLTISRNLSPHIKIEKPKNHDLMFISCHDRAGQLDPKVPLQIVLDHMLRGIVMDLKIDKAQRAGLGTYLMLNQSIAMLFGVRKNVETKVGCFLSLSGPAQMAAQAPKSFFVIPSSN